MDVVRSGLVLSFCSIVLVLGGCDTPPPAPVDGGRPVDAYVEPSCTELLEMPGDGLLSMWPNRELLVDDATTVTGRRIRITEDAFPDLFRRLGAFTRTITDDLSEPDGFSITADAYFQFNRPLDESMLPAPEDTALPATGVGFVVIEPGPARIVPVILRTTDEGATLMLAPMTPLPPRGRVAAYVTRALTDAARGCFEPSEAMAAALASPDAEDADAIGALTALGVVAASSELVALTTFPTQSIVEDGVRIAEDIAGRTYDWAPGGTPTCTTDTAYEICEGSFLAGDYRDADGVIRLDATEEAEPVAQYEIPVTIYLPLVRTGAVPTFVYGHGLTGDRHQAGRLADFGAPRGYATVAIDAAEHGEHPTVGGAPRDALGTLLGFFGIDTASDDHLLNAAQLRDNFAGSAFDRLQLAALLEAHPDIDGDGTDDLDMSQFAYLGVSLGGIMGPQELALDDRLGAGVLVVPGGRVSTIISDSDMFGVLITALRPAGTTDGDVRRFFPLLQTVLDRGDPVAWAPYLLESRLPGVTGLPSILCGVVLDDDTVPNIANYALGRAIGVPIVGTLLRDEPGFELVPSPLAGNFTLGTDVATGGLLQFDVVTEPGGPEMATHGNVGDSDVGVEAWLHFLETHFEGGPAEIEDPYETLGVAHAP